MKAVRHSERSVKVDKFPNQLFDKHWDDVKKIEYIIVEGKKYYISYPLKLHKEIK